MAPQLMGTKGLVPALAVVMDGPGHQFLAGAAFPGDQDVDPAAGDLLDQVVDLLHRLALADQAAEGVTPAQLLFQLDVFLAQVLALQGVFDDEADLFVLEGLGDVVVGPLLHRLDRLFGGGKGGDHDHHRFGEALLDVGEQLEPAQTRHLDIADDQIVSLVLQSGRACKPSATASTW